MVPLDLMPKACQSCAMTTSPSIHPLVAFAVRRRVTMGMLVIAVSVLGVLSLQRLPLEFLPAISSSNVSVRVSFPSSAPEEVARRIVRPLEDSLGTLENLDRLSSRASADSAEINVGFVDGTDMDLAAVEVRDRIDRVRHLLPPDVQQVRIRRFQTSDIPVLRFDLSIQPGEEGWTSEALYDYAEQVIQRRLERLGGVAQADLRGLQTRQVLVQLDTDRLTAHGVDVRQLVATLRNNHLTTSVGDVTGRGSKQHVRVVGDLASLEEIRSLRFGPGSVRLGDVAAVTYDYPRQERYNFLNGRETLSVRVYKTSSANLLQVVEAVKNELAALQQEPDAAGLALRVFHDSSEDVEKGLGELRTAGLLGGSFALLAVYLFLRRRRVTLLIGVAIPMSVVLAFVIMFLLRQLGWAAITLNVVSLMGLVLALGMLVDNSIVVIESIYRRLAERGEDPETAALRGASEVALPILASTATTLCVFVPLIFLRSGGGFFSHYLREVGTTVCIVMVASLLVALTVVPMVAALVLRQEPPPESTWLHRLENLYGTLVGWTLRWRLPLLVLAAGLLWSSWWLFGSIERSFGSRTQARQLTIFVDTPSTYNLQQTEELFAETYGLLSERRRELDISDISHEYRVGGGRSRGGFGGDKEFTLYLVDEEQASLTTNQVRDALRELLTPRPGVQFRIAQSQRGHGSNGLEVQILGEDVEVLELLGREIAAQMAALSGIEDIDLSLESGTDELVIEVQRERAMAAGMSSRQVAMTVESALSSRAVTTLEADDREIDVVVQYQDAEEGSVDELRNVAVFTPLEDIEGSGSSLPLDTLTTFEVRPGPTSIERENRLSKITVNANTDDPIMARRAMMGITGLLQSFAMPPGYSWSFGRFNRMDSEDEEGANFALLFAILLVYMMMAALFESFAHPLSIMLSVPFAFIGVGVVMKLASQPRDNFTELGFIILIGVVVNNAIVLVDHINRLRQEGMERSAAIVLGGRHRLRAILMTAITTMLGLLPMVAPILLPQWFGPLEGRSATWAPVGLVILGGLTTSTFLTLVILPTLYSLVDDVSQFFRRLLAAALRSTPEPVVRSVKEPVA